MSAPPRVLSNLVDSSLTASLEAEWIRVHMSTQKNEASSVEGAATPHEAKTLPKPPVLWLLIPVALLVLLVLLSRG